MLVLSRKPTEKIMIGDDVEITLLEVCGKNVRLGIKAPQDVAVYRKEVYDRRQSEGGDDQAAPLSPGP